MKKTMNTANTQRIALLIRQCEYATASTTSSAFFRFSKQEFQDLAIQVNKEHHDLITEMFRSLDDIFRLMFLLTKCLSPLRLRQPIENKLPKLMMLL